MSNHDPETCTMCDGVGNVLVAPYTVKDCPACAAEPKLDTSTCPECEAIGQINCSTHCMETPGAMALIEAEENRRLELWPELVAALEALREHQDFRYRVVSDYCMCCHQLKLHHSDKCEIGNLLALLARLQPQPETGDE